MTVFSEPSYTISKHAIDRWCSKRIHEHFPRSYAEKIILEFVQEGTIILTFCNHRYIRNGDFLFPCIKIGPNLYKVKTVLTWNMAKNKINRFIQKNTAS